MRVLIVEDEAMIRQMVGEQLERRGVGIVSAGTVAASREALEHEDFHAIILDLGLPDGSGFDILAELRASGSSTHVIVLTGAASEADRIHAIEAGADDVVVKPFFVRELAARVLAVERRRSLSEDRLLRIGPLEIDLKACEVVSGDRTIELTNREFDLLAFLAARPGQTFSRAELLRAVWKSSAEWQQSATVTEHMRRLRTKIEADPRHPEMLKTVRGVGYRMDPPEHLSGAHGTHDTEQLRAGALTQVDGPATPVAAELRRALDTHQFEVHYQPVVALSDGSPKTVEALVRWQHPARGLLGPDSFIEAIERNGMIVELGVSILDIASRQVASWRHRGADVDLSVNVSAAELADPGFVGRIIETIDAAGLEPDALWLEVAETSLVRDIDRAAAKLHRLADLGVRIAIDDFSAGWASLASLSKFPIRALKIDRIFVASIDENANDRAIAKSILQLGAELGLDVVAEGIETVAQCDALQALGCVTGQGYLFGRPTPADAVPLHLAPSTDGSIADSIDATARTPGSPSVEAVDAPPPPPSDD